MNIQIILYTHKHVILQQQLIYEILKKLNHKLKHKIPHKELSISKFKFLRLLVAQLVSPL